MAGAAPRWLWILALFHTCDSRRFREREYLEEHFIIHDHGNPTDHISHAPRFIFLSPNLLRVGSKEVVYLEAQNVTASVNATVTVRDFPSRNLLTEQTVELNEQNAFHALTTIEVPPETPVRVENTNKYVYVQANFGAYSTPEQEVMVTYHAGYIFIQTDKPMYNPGDTVKFRAFVSSPAFMAATKDIILQLQNAEGETVSAFPKIMASDGITAKTYKLPDLVSEGTWKVVAKFDDWKQNTFTAEFQVKKHVLPAFNVTLTTKKPFFHLKDTELEVEILANYLYGEPVQGTAYVLFGVEFNQEKTRLADVKQVAELNSEGEGIVKLTMDEIKKQYPDIGSLVGRAIYIKASVLTKSGSDLVEVEKTGIKIVSSPYFISFRDSPKYFKPGLPIQLTIQVSHHDGSPARDVPVQLSLEKDPLMVTTGTLRVSVNMPMEMYRQTLTAETRKEGLQPEEQARRRITLQPYTPFDGQKQNYLYISTSANSVSLAEKLTLSFTISTADKAHRELITHLTYLVLAKGRILVAKRLGVKGHLFTGVELTVTKEMMPSFRVVAFYVVPWARQTEVVSDSVWVDVKDTCVVGLSVGPGPRSKGPYRPGNLFSFQVRGEPGAKVSLVAVDNAIYLLNRERLTQKKLWDVVERGDLGCTLGGGRSSMGVFGDAGLLFSSDNGGSTFGRTALQCPGSARKRRSAELLKRRIEAESLYQGEGWRCCQDGLRSVPMPYSCTRRSLYITEGWACMLAFRHCCALFRGEELDTRRPPATAAPPIFTTPPPTTPPPRVWSDGLNWYWEIAGTEERRTHTQDHFGLQRTHTHAIQEHPRVNYATVQFGEHEEEEEDEDESVYMDEGDVSLRSKFYESWLWRDASFPSVPERSARDGLALLPVSHALPDSITEWGILAISSSPVTGFCVAEPYKVQVTREFFVDLRLPYSVARNEHVEIKAVLHNYRDEDLHVRVELQATDKMCSVAFQEKHTQEVKVAARSSVAVPYTVVPLEAGSLPLQVLALGKSTAPTGDRVQKMLRVVVEGVERRKVETYVLNPSDSGGKQVIQVKKLELNSLVPNSKPETRLNIRGNLLADTIDNSISPDSLASLIRMPGGCVEQNLAGITLPLIATLYLDRSNNWEGVGVSRRAEALRYITTGYEKQLKYRKSDHSYPPYLNEGASTWVTAYVVKVFSMASPLTALQKEHVCDPLRYLLNNKHLRSGGFREDNPVYDTAMTGGLQGAESQTTLTAFVSIALSEAKSARLDCYNYGSYASPMDAGISKTAGYLRMMLPRIKRPYSVAIASYATSLIDKTAFRKDLLLRAAAPDGSHWPDSDNRLFTLEATGYALLALIQSGNLDEAAAPFRWLNQRRGIGGGYGSTQPTMIVLQALSEYLVHRPPSQALSLMVDIKVPGRSNDLRYHFVKRNAYQMRSSTDPLLQDGFTVEASGTGQGTLQVVTYYHELPEVSEESGCEHFDLNVTLAESTEKPPADALKSYSLTIDVRAKGPSEVKMVVLDISLPTGFTPDNADLEGLTNSVDRYISNFKVVDNLSDRGSLIIHLFKVSNEHTDTITFRLHQAFKVGLLQPSSVTIYEYYNPDHTCARYYSPKEKLEELARVCAGDVCRCTQGDCCVAKADTQTQPEGTRKTFACSSLHHVFKAKVLNISQSQYDKYDMEITQVIRLGVDQGARPGQSTVFLSHGQCRGGLNLQQGREYLIIGPMTDVWNKKSATNGVTYMLTKHTWLERWPSTSECSTDASLQPRCSELAKAIEELQYCSH